MFSIYGTNISYSVIYLPNNVVTSIMNSIVGSTNLEYDSVNGYYKIGCSSAKSNTKIQLKTFTKSSISTNPVLANIPLADFITSVDTDYIYTATTCMIGIITSSGTSSIGESMLRCLYTVFDAGQDRIAIAGAAGSASGVTRGRSRDTSYTTTTKDYKSSGSQLSYELKVTKTCLLFPFMTPLLYYIKR